MRRYCDHIREDAYECTNKGVWVISPDNDPHRLINSCNDHLTKLLPKDQSSYVGYLGKL